MNDMWQAWLVARFTISSSASLGTAPEKVSSARPTTTARSTS